MSATEQAPTPLVFDDAATTAPSVGPLHADRLSARLPAWARRAWPWFMVTKPRIIELLLVTTVPTMVVAAGGWPGWWLVVNTVVGGALTAGSANAINNAIDREVDAVMARTSERPTVRDGLPPRAVVRYGVGLGVLGFAWLAVFVNLTAALLATSAILFYVFVYTLGLKRRTPQAVVIGGAAGCVPVLTGWAAVPGTSLTAPEPWVLFALVFWWTPPHFWALAMKYREDYARAGIPLLNVTHGNVEATRHILLYSWLLFSVVLLTLVGLQASAWYAALALAMTAFWLRRAHVLRREPTVRNGMWLFHYSTSYLAVLFLAAAVDAVV